MALRTSEFQALEAQGVRAQLCVVINTKGLMMTPFIGYLAGNTSGLSNELTDPLNAGRNIACRPLLFYCTKLVQELRDNLCQISHCS